MKKDKFDIYEFLQEFKKSLIKRYGLKWFKTYLPYDLLDIKVLYYMIISERSDGKSFIFGEMILFLYTQYGYCGMLLRRFDMDIRGKNGEQLISNFIGENSLTKERTKGKYNNAVEELTDKKYNTIIYKSRRYYLAKIYDDENGKEMISIDPNPFMFAWAISQQTHNRGGGMEKIKIILFDEIVSREGYLMNEFIDFQDTLKTIIRRRDDVLIFMCGNAIDRYCIYFDEMQLKGVKNQQKGTIDIYRGDVNDPSIAVEIVDYVSKEHKKSNKYFNFNNPKIKSDLLGKWEIGSFPHLPCKYKPKDVQYRYYIIFDNEQFECEIVVTENDEMFTFIHPWTSEIKMNDDTLIFDLNCQIGFNYRKRITNVYDDIGKTIASFFKQDKVCYSDNQTGDTIHAYLRACTLK